MLHECVEDNIQACSPVLKSQLVSVFSLNLQMIGDKCRLNMIDETPKDKAREMYSKLVEIMLMGENRMGMLHFPLSKLFLSSKQSC